MTASQQISKMAKVNMHDLIVCCCAETANELNVRRSKATIKTHV
jgi:hypothetical protein